ncbi:MAG: hypothetical protein NDJ90_13950, partial [Oligoflexia bacterium]|nr:hypothetical protein [Oligoflexia bacterium]
MVVGRGARDRDRPVGVERLVVEQFVHPLPLEQRAGSQEEADVAVQRDRRAADRGALDGEQVDGEGHGVELADDGRRFGLELHGVPPGHQAHRREVVGHDAAQEHEPDVAEGVEHLAVVVDEVLVVVLVERRDEEGPVAAGVRVGVELVEHVGARLVEPHGGLAAGDRRGGVGIAELEAVHHRGLGEHEG